MNHTNPDTETASVLIKDLAAAFVERPEDLKVASQDSLTGETYFALKGNRADDPFLIGNGGCHVDALSHLVSRFGSALRKTWTFRLITDDAKHTRNPRQPRDVISYDPRPARDLLCRILEALELGAFKVEVGPGTGVRNSMTFVFDVSVRHEDDAAALLKTRRLVVREASPRAPERAIEMSDIDAIGTLFRAMAKRDGVRFQVNIVKP